MRNWGEGSFGVMELGNDGMEEAPGAQRGLAPSGEWLVGKGGRTFLSAIAIYKAG